MPYSGWVNWETWQMKIILDMNEDLDEVIQEKIKNEDVDRLSAEDMIKITSEYLSDYIYEQLPEVEFPWSAYFDSAINNVNWRELAEEHLKEWGFLTRKGRKRQTGPKEWSP